MCPPVAGPGPTANGLTLAAVLHAGLQLFRRTYQLPRYQWKILSAIQQCRTPALGGHRYQCAHCGREHFVAHGCGNRHCPQCQGAQAFDWLERQRAVLLPIPYFHVVFTLPHALNPLIQQNRRTLYQLLFDAASRTLLQFGRQRFQAQIGVTAVLHTWGQKLGAAILHCIVSGGGWALNGSGWVSSGSHYLFPIQALSRLGGEFRAGLHALRAQGKLEFHGEVAALARPTAWTAFGQMLQRQEWVVYAKRPFAGPKQVLAYLSRYTHRVAISPRRLLALTETTIAFGYKDYADGHRRKTLTLGLPEFVRRFGLHLLPERFVKIRHYGLLSNRQRLERIARIRTALSGPSNSVTTPPPVEPPAVTETRLRCPHCGALALIWMAEVPRPHRRARVPILDTS